MNDLILTIKIFYCKLFQNPLFILQIKDEKIIVLKGSPKSSFINECIEIVKHNKLYQGIIYVVKNQFGNTVLQISSEIPQDTLQQFRNVWAFS